MATFRSITVTNTSTNIKTTGGDVRQLNIVNKHSAAIFVRFYDSPVATFQDTPVKTFQVAANNIFTLLASESAFPLLSTSAGLCVRVVTDAGDNGNTAAGTLPVIEIDYK